MNTASCPPDSSPETLRLETDPPPAAAQSANPRKQANHLTLKQSVQLYHWLDQPTERAFVATESDAAAASKATQELGFLITAPNILHTRRELGIEKTKPAKDPATPESTDPSLADLQRRLAAAESRIEALQVKATNMDEAIALLRQQLTLAESRLTKLERTPDLTAAPFNG